MIKILFLIHALALPASEPTAMELFNQDPTAYCTAFQDMDDEPVKSCTESPSDECQVFLNKCVGGK